MMQAHFADCFAAAFFVALGFGLFGHCFLQLLRQGFPP
jgi:hypothetical protein